MKAWLSLSLSLFFSSVCRCCVVDKKKTTAALKRGREGGKDRKQPASAKHSVFHVRVNFVGQTQTRVNNASPLPLYQEIIPSSRKYRISTRVGTISTTDYNSITKVNRLSPFVGITKRLIPSLSPPRRSLLPISLRCLSLLTGIGSR